MVKTAPKVKPRFRYDREVFGGFVTVEPQDHQICVMVGDVPMEAGQSVDSSLLSRWEPKFPFLKEDVEMKDRTLESGWVLSVSWRAHDVIIATFERAKRRKHTLWVCVDDEVDGVRQVHFAWSK